MFKKLRNNFVLLNMIIISSVMIFAFASIYFFMHQNTMLNVQDKLSSLPVDSPRFIEIPEDDIFQGGVLPTDYALSFNLIFNSDGSLNRINSYVDMTMTTYQLAAQTALNNEEEYGTIKLEDRIWIYKIRERRIDSNNNLAIVFLDITESIDNLNNLLFTFITVGILMLIVIYIISVYFAKKSVKGIEESWNKQKQFITDASHEFKTPIAVIEANTDALLLKNNKKDKKWINYIKAETSRMNKLVTDLLYLAKTENMDITFTSEPFNISQTLNKVILSMEAIIFEKQLTLKQNIEDNLIFKGDETRLEQVMIILIDNAIKYTNDLGTITINLIKRNKAIEFAVENTGTGIAKDNLDKVFDRFYQSDPSRVKTDNSYGLGLSIAKSTIERIGGKINVTSIPDKSTIFTVTLKIK